MIYFFKFMLLILWISQLFSCQTESQFKNQTLPNSTAVVEGISCENLAGGYEVYEVKNEKSLLCEGKPCKEAQYKAGLTLSCSGGVLGGEVLLGHFSLPPPGKTIKESLVISNDDSVLDMRYQHNGCDVAYVFDLKTVVDKKGPVLEGRYERGTCQEKPSSNGFVLLFPSNPATKP